jgi:REP element-mobilizing transposase RayT
MGYGPRDEAAGFHHVIARGNNRRLIFRGEDDRVVFLHMLRLVARKQDWAIHAFALMTNHYHLVVRVGACGLARGICRLNSGYAAWFNAQEERVNHLFGRRYWNDRLEDEQRYFAAVRYVVRNPLRAGIPVPFERQSWTSYPETLGRTVACPVLARSELLRHFGEDDLRALAYYRSLCTAQDGPAYVPVARPDRTGLAATRLQEPWPVSATDSKP